MTAKDYFFPETQAGGFSRRDGTVEFFSRVNALLTADAVVVDFGAGRGRGAAEDPVPYRRALRSLQAKCRRLVAVDIDDAVLQNPSVDEAHLVREGERLPFADSSIDLIVSDMTFEHIIDPEQTIAELKRVLKPGGWICARTPNRWGYIGIGANLIPNRFHASLLKYLQPQRNEVDIFPTTYRLNTYQAFSKIFPANQFINATYSYTSEPSYLAQAKAAWWIMLLVERIIPPKLAPFWHIFLQKRHVGREAA
ncbi:MAG: class I SAM-dependent methyltransferase [Thiohalocapsa sp.]